MELFARSLHAARQATRSLARRPGLSIAAIATLALGLGAATAIFGVVDAVLLAPLPWGAPEETVMVWSRWKDFEKTWVSEAEVLDYRDRTQTLADVAAWGVTQVNLTGDGLDPERLGAAAITANTLDVLGVRPVLGRGFTPEEDLPETADVVLLSWELFQRRWGGDRSLLDRTIEVNGTPRRVVGVLPAGFRLPTDYTEDLADPSRLWLPLGMNTADPVRGSHGLYAAARLAPGATPEAASAELAAVTAALTREGEYRPEMGFTAFAVPLRQEVLGGSRRALLLVGGASVLLLMVACANVASLLLARAEDRRRELGVRCALGAGRGPLLRGLMAEGLVLAGFGCALGLGLAWMALKLLALLPPPGIPRVETVVLDARAVAFAIVAALVAVLAFSLGPVLKASGLDLSGILKEEGRSAGAGGRRQAARSVLVVVEVATAAALAVGAGVMVRTLQALQEVDLGLTPQGVLTARLTLPAADYEEPSQVTAFYEALRERVEALPGVREAGFLRSLPLGSTIGDWGLDVEGFEESPGNHAKGDWQVAGPGALEALGIRLASGRLFTDADTAEARQVALVNETMARAYWPGRDPIGGTLRMGSDDPDAPWVTVVGVVKDVRHNGITGQVKGKFYRPLAQFHRSTGFPIRGVNLVVTTDGDPLQLVAPLRAAVRELDPDVPLAAVRTMDEVVAAAMATQRFTGRLLLGFAAMSLLLSAVGVYGLLAWLVAARTREIGVRRAIGARQHHLIRLVVGRGLALASLGLAVGLPVSVLGATAMEGLLYGVQPVDPVTLATVPAVLLAAAAAASFTPAWRATRVEPMAALRQL